MSNANIKNPVFEFDSYCKRKIRKTKGKCIDGEDCTYCLRRWVYKNCVMKEAKAKPGREKG
jgi:hypothetical protein